MTDDKMKEIWLDGDGYRWSQTRDDVTLRIALPDGTRGRDLSVQTKHASLSIRLKRDDSALLDGELFGKIRPDDTLWTIEDECALEVVLAKAKHHEVWQSVLAGQGNVDLLTKQELDKQLMLEKFQADHPGFDFSGADFTGQVPDDPVNFAKFD
jgi:CS domain